MSSSNHSTEDNRNELSDEPSAPAPPLEGWTREDKETLLASLRMHGSHKVDEIQMDMPTKTESEITAVINYYRKQAIKTKGLRMMKRLRKSRLNPCIPLSQWVHFLKEDYEYYGDLRTETVHAMRLIAKFEDFPSPFVTEQIDFRKVYHLLAEALNGKAVTANRLIVDILHSCLLDMVALGRSFIKPSSYNFLIESVIAKKLKPLKDSHKNEDNETIFLENLSSQSNYNPFNIPMDYLAPFTQVIVEED